MCVYDVYCIYIFIIIAFICIRAYRNVMRNAHHSFPSGCNGCLFIFPSHKSVTAASMHIIIHFNTGGPFHSCLFIALEVDSSRSSTSDNHMKWQLCWFVRDFGWCVRACVCVFVCPTRWAFMIPNGFIMPNAFFFVPLCVYVYTRVCVICTFNALVYAYIFANPTIIKANTQYMYVYQMDTLNKNLLSGHATVVH